MKLNRMLDIMKEWEVMENFTFTDSVSDKLDRNLQLYLKSLENIVYKTNKRNRVKVAEEIAKQ